MAEELREARKELAAYKKAEMGDAAGKKEKRDVSGIIRRVNGITNIINFVRVKK